MPPQAATNSTQALQNLQNFQTNEQTPDQIQNQENQNLGVSQAQQQVSGLRTAISNTTNLLNQVAPTVQGNTANSLVTASQANQQISNAEAPLNTQLNSETGDYNNANANYTDLEQQAEAQASNDLGAQNNQLSALQNTYQDLFSQEQATQAQQAAQQAAAVQEQQFQEQLSESAREANLAAEGSSSDLGSLLGGITNPSASATAPAAPKTATTNANETQQQAYNAVADLLATNNSQLIRNTITAIQKSASYGNTTDLYKLQVLASLEKQNPNLAYGILEGVQPGNSTLGNNPSF